jgi:hypothetical protein
VPRALEHERPDVRTQEALHLPSEAGELDAFVVGI